MARLQGKVAVLTGAGAGIGAATARLFCREGAAVLLVDASRDALAATAKLIANESAGARIATFTADVTDGAQAVAAAEATLDQFGQIDVLVNNAAMRNYTRVAEVTPAEWQAMVSVNLVGLSNYAKATLPALRQRKGAIVNVSSAYAVTGRKGMGLYDATKAGILSLTRTLACEEAEHGVRVNAVCPGSTLTDFHKGRAVAAGKSVDKLKTERSNTSLLGRWAEPDEIAWPIVFLASAEASYITGATLMVDGGLSVI